MRKLSFANFKRIFWVVSGMIWCIGLTLMLCNTGVIQLKIPAAHTDTDLIYNGEYIDLLAYEESLAPLEEGEICVTTIDGRTGFPATANMSLIGKNGNATACVDVVRFTHQGLPAMLRFTNNVADGFTYLCMIPDWRNDQQNIWETDPNFLRNVLNDYSLQVSAICD